MGDERAGRIEKRREAMIRAPKRRVEACDDTGPIRDFTYDLL
jgi:hypothetical protein